MLSFSSLSFFLVWSQLVILHRRHQTCWKEGRWEKKIILNLVANQTKPNLIDTFSGSAWLRRQESAGTELDGPWGENVGNNENGGRDILKFHRGFLL